ncbi:MAG: TetR/AcrR family transcriptional regulator [Caldilineaceae bacterium]|nr:TetR/AcrR family transcriptional regulator [Caldilineaceae bacterium]HRJ41068.1 TetR/AcrR family transcriptional regulator [Caldilineaceae bacterium]
MTEPTTSDSKDTILDAAQELIAQHGFAGFSIRDLSRESGLAKGTIYHHFVDKRAIYRSVMERDLAHMTGAMQEALTGIEDPVRWLHAFVAAFLRNAEARRTHIRALLRELGAMEDGMLQVARRVRDQVGAQVEDTIERGIAQGCFRPVHPQVAVMSLIGAMNTYIAWQLVVEDGAIDPATADVIVDFFLFGLIKEERSL